MDWRGCPDVERRTDVVSNAWVVRGTRVPADAIVDNARDGFTAEQIVSELFPTVPLERARRVLAFADAHEAHPA